MSKYTEAQNRAAQKYTKKAYDSTLVRIRKDGEITLSVIQQIAEQHGESVQGFILQAIRERIDRMKDE